MVSLPAAHSKVLFVTIINAHANSIVFYNNSRHLINGLVQRYTDVDASGASVPGISDQFNNRWDRA